MHARAQRSNRLARANRASHGARVSPHTGKGESEENKGKSKGKSKGTKSANQGAKGVHKGKTSKAGLSESAQTCPTANPWFHDGTGMPILVPLVLSLQFLVSAD